MIIETGEVPDAALDALMGWVGANLTREGWRGALAEALTEWEKRPRDLAAPAHECLWKVRGVKQQKILGMSQTFVLQRCEGCGELKTQQLSGEWDMADL